MPLNSFSRANAFKLNPHPTHLPSAFSEAPACALQWIYTDCLAAPIPIGLSRHYRHL